MTCRVAAAGDPDLTPPAGRRPGRFTELRLSWLLLVRAAADAATRLRAAAAVAGIDPQKAVELVERAYKLDLFGPGSPGTTPMTQDQAKAAWSALTGKDFSDPAVQDEVYKAVADLRRRELEQSAKLAAARAAARDRRRPTR